MWLIISVIGYLALAVVAVLDKFIVSDERVPPVRFVFYSTVFVLPIVLLAPFGVRPLLGGDWGVALLSGTSFALGLWGMYRGFVTSEVSHLGPLIGAVTPIGVLFLSQAWLGENIGARQLLGVLVLSSGSFLISFEQSRRHSTLPQGILWGAASALLFALSHVSAKYLYTRYGFYSGFVWSRAVLGFFGVFLLAVPRWRQIIFRRAPAGAKKEKSATKGFGSVIINKSLGVFGVVAIQYASALGSVTLVNALAGLQFAFLIGLVAALSRWRPQLFREKYTRGEMRQEAIAVLVVGAGLLLLL